MMGAFVEAFDAEMKAATHQALVDGYRWANRQTYGPNPDLDQRAERWAQRVEAAGHTSLVLQALSKAHEPSDDDLWFQGEHG